MSACQLVVNLLVSETWREASEIALKIEPDSGEDERRLDRAWLATIGLFPLC